MQKKEKSDNSRTIKIAFLVIILITFMISIFLYPVVPNTMITHWGINDEPNGFSSKEFGLFFVPVLMIIFAIILYFVPLLDPMKKNIEKFRNDYNNLILLLLLFLLYVHILSILLNLGLNASISQLLSPAFAILLFYLGVIIGKMKRNYFIGIRTPWTLNSDDNWEKTDIVFSEYPVKGEKFFEAMSPGHSHLARLGADIFCPH